MERSCRKVFLHARQAGIPSVRVVSAGFDGFMKSYTFTLEQMEPSDPGQPAKRPLPIPVKLGLLGKRSKKDVLNPPSQVHTYSSTSTVCIHREKTHGGS